MFYIEIPIKKKDIWNADKVTVTATKHPERLLMEVPMNIK